MICLLGRVGSRCVGMDKGDTCTVLHPDATWNNMVRKGSCEFKNIRAPKVGIYLPKGAKIKNSIKVSKGK